MPKKWVIYALIAIGFAGLIGAHELTPAGSPDDADLVVPFILTVIGTLSFVAAGVIAFRMLKGGG
jgi:hypothetical protein